MKELTLNKTMSSDGQPPPSLQRKIDACPAAGGGLHNYLSVVANELRHNVTPERGFEILRDLAIEHGRPAKDATNEARELLKKWNHIQLSTHTIKATIEVTHDVTLINQVVLSSEVSAYDHSQVQLTRTKES
jgi:hypothetical protein